MPPRIPRFSPRLRAFVVKSTLLSPRRHRDTERAVVQRRAAHAMVGERTGTGSCGAKRGRAWPCFFGD
jgi:hypothetical protein